MSDVTQDQQDQQGSTKEPGLPQDMPRPETNAPENALDQDAPDETAALKTQIGELEQSLAEQKDNWLRARAEAENARRRAQEEVARARKFAVEKFAGDLLTVKDSLEAALASERQTAEDLRGGVELTLKQLTAAFEKSELREINPVGEKFDPHLHQAMAIQTEPVGQEANTVTRVFQKGYLLADRVLRPAMVMVAQAAAPEAS